MKRLIIILLLLSFCYTNTYTYPYFKQIKKERQKKVVKNVFLTILGCGLQGFVISFAVKHLRKKRRF